MGDKNSTQKQQADVLQVEYGIDDVGIFIRKCAQNLWICFVPHTHRTTTHWDVDIQNGWCARCRNRYENSKMMTLEENSINKFNKIPQEIKKKIFEFPSLNELLIANLFLLWRVTRIANRNMQFSLRFYNSLEMLCPINFKSWVILFVFIKAVIKSKKHLKSEGKKNDGNSIKTPTLIHALYSIFKDSLKCLYLLS